MMPISERVHQNYPRYLTINRLTNGKVSQEQFYQAFDRILFESLSTTFRMRVRMFSSTFQDISGLKGRNRNSYQFPFSFHSSPNFLFGMPLLSFPYRFHYRKKGEPKSPETRTSRSTSCFFSEMWL